MVKAAITAQYQRADDSWVPATMASDEATATWTAWRVLGASRSTHEPSGTIPPVVRSPVAEPSAGTP